MEDGIKVSVLMPSLNVVKYIRQCLDSVVGQTLTEIEILCIDAGSDDGTLEILREYERNDSRVKVLLSDRKSYGYQMNLGLNAARGKYIGIVETDDWAEPDMFEKLYQAAVSHDADVVWSNFYSYTTSSGENDEFFENLEGCGYEKLTNAYEAGLFDIMPSIWTGVYKKSFLESEHIRFNETLGASYQDASFHLMVCSAADKVVLLKNAYLHYRRDNENSSVNTEGKVYCVCDEMHYFEHYAELYGKNKDRLFRVYYPLKFSKYIWNFNRISIRSQRKFLSVMREEFLQHEKNGCLREENFSPNSWRLLQQVLHQPLRFYLAYCKGPAVLVTARNAWFTRKGGKIV